jgi:pyruvate, water dikinase
MANYILICNALLKHIYILLSLLFLATNVVGQNSYTFNINSKAQFDAYKGKPLNDNYTEVSTIKLCYHLKQKKLYFINSQQYVYHMDFCSAEFSQENDIADFNRTNYTINASRNYLLASYNYYQQQNVYTLEFVSEDNMSKEHLQELYNALMEHTKGLSKAKLFINNLFLLHLDKEIIADKIYPNELFGAQQNQKLVEGSVCGIAKKIDLKKDFYKVQAHEIIFIKGTPLSLPICAAVVTETFQTPLSHIAILSHNRKIPSAVIINYDSLLSANNWWDKPIKLTVNNNGISIKACALSEVKKATVKPKKLQVLQSDFNFKKINSFTKNSVANKKQIGSKAAGMQELYKVQGRYEKLFEVPGKAFAIPFYYFKQHIKHPRIQKELVRLFNAKNLTELQTDSMLKRIRKAIKQVPIDTSLINTVQRKLTKDVPYRFRSSGNAEDLKNFNGAGLYESATGIINSKDKSVEDAIKKVWASVYKLAAYRERKLFNIYEPNVAMAVLVHRAFPNETANGVAVTKNLYRSGFSGFTINVQVGEESVVIPNDTVQCDQIILLPEENFLGSGAQVYPQYVANSNITKGKNVLTPQELSMLYNALEQVKQHYYSKELQLGKYIEYEDYALDIEFKFDNGLLYLKQVRPFK